MNGSRDRRQRAASRDGAQAEVVEQRPYWRERAIERSLSTARERAVSRSDRFIGAAAELLEQTGRTDFTVQQLVERSKTSLRSFYQHFASKDELLLALFEEVIRDTVDVWRTEADRYDNAADQLRSVMVNLYSSVTDTASADRLSRALTVYHLKLAESRPDDFSHVLGPLEKLLREIIQAGAESGQFRGDIAPRQLTLALMQTLVAAAHMHALGAYLTGEHLSPDELWKFCHGGLTNR